MVKDLAAIGVVLDADIGVDSGGVRFEAELVETCLRESIQLQRYQQALFDGKRLSCIRYEHTTGSLLVACSVNADEMAFTTSICRLQSRNGDSPDLIVQHFVSTDSTVHSVSVFIQDNAPQVLVRTQLSITLYAITLCGRWFKNLSMSIICAVAKSFTSVCQSPFNAFESAYTLASGEFGLMDLSMDYSADRTVYSDTRDDVLNANDKWQRCQFGYSPKDLLLLEHNSLSLVDFRAGRSSLSLFESAKQRLLDFCATETMFEIGLVGQKAIQLLDIRMPGKLLLIHNEHGVDSDRIQLYSLHTSENSCLAALGADAFIMPTVVYDHTTHSTLGGTIIPHVYSDLDPHFINNYGVVSASSISADMQLYDARPPLWGFDYFSSSVSSDIETLTLLSDGSLFYRKLNFADTTTNFTNAEEVETFKLGSTLLPDVYIRPHKVSNLGKAFANLNEVDPVLDPVINVGKPLQHLSYFNFNSQGERVACRFYSDSTKELLEVSKKSELAEHLSSLWSLPNSAQSHAKPQDVVATEQSNNTVPVPVLSNPVIFQPNVLELPRSRPAAAKITKRKRSGFR